MDEIKEAQLIEYIKNDVIKKLTIIQDKERNYRLELTTTWKNEISTVVTSRGHVRLWVSLDRLIAYLQNQEGSISSIELKLYKKPFRSLI